MVLSVEGGATVYLGFPLQPKHRWRVHEKSIIYRYSTYLYTFQVSPVSSAPAISCQSPPKTECQLSGGVLYILADRLECFRSGLAASAYTARSLLVAGLERIHAHYEYIYIYKGGSARRINMPVLKVGVTVLKDLE